MSYFAGVTGFLSKLPTADGPKQDWSWDITYLLTTVLGVWHYLDLVVEVWSRNVVA